MKKTIFDTTVLSFGNNTGIEVPLTNLNELGLSKKPAVHVKIGTYEYSTTVATMKGKYMISLSKEHRDKMGVRGGDSVSVTLTLIEGKREVELPAILFDFFTKHHLMDSFNALSYSVRKEMVRKIVDAKKPETREKRLIDLKETLTAK